MLDGLERKGQIVIDERGTISLLIGQISRTVVVWHPASSISIRRHSLRD